MTANYSLYQLFSTPLGKTSLVFTLFLLVVVSFSMLASPILLAIAISMMMYGGMSPLVDVLVRRGFTTSQSVSLTMAIIVILIVGLAIVIIPLIVNQLHHLSLHIDNLDSRIFHLFYDINQWTTAHMHWGFDPASISHGLLTTMSEKAAYMSLAITNYASDIAFSILLIPLITFFLLCDFRSLRNQAMQLLPNRHFELGWIIYERTSKQLQRYLRGILIQSVILAAICSTGFSLAGIDYALLLGILVGLLNMIPFFGISLAKIPPVLVVLLSDQPDISSIITALIVVFIAQFIDATIIIPKIVAKSANLHPLTVMLSVALAGYYAGIFGLLLVVPILFSSKVVFTELYRGVSHKQTCQRTG